MARRRSRRAESSPNFQLPLVIAEYAVPGLSPLLRGISVLSSVIDYVQPKSELWAAQAAAVTHAKQIWKAEQIRLLKRRRSAEAGAVLFSPRAQTVNFRGAAALASRVCLDRGQRKEVLFAKRIAGRAGGSPGPYRVRSRVKC